MRTDETTIHLQIMSQLTGDDLVSTKLKLEHLPPITRRVKNSTVLQRPCIVHRNCVSSSWVCYTITGR